MSTNEAAERLVPREWDDTNWETCPLCGDDGRAGDMRAKLTEWFAAEHKATVERIRERLILKDTDEDNQPFYKVDRDFIDAILDEEAAR